MSYSQKLLFTLHETVEGKTSDLGIRLDAFNKAYGEAVYQSKLLPDRFIDIFIEFRGKLQDSFRFKNGERIG